MPAPDQPGRHPLRAFAWCSAATVLVSAFLLFQVQPLISRTILPWFGGSPAVWSACMLFFQVLLLAGYGYAHALSRLRQPRWQFLLHAGLLVAALATMPITVDASWKPPDSLRPVGRILLLLLAHVGLPYFLLSATGPLVQAWYARVAPGSPYRLYALSNLGSLAALLTYPVLVEPHWDTTRQGLAWSGGFVVFALLCGELSRRFAARAPRVLPAAERQPAETGPWRLASWLLLPAVASVMLLAVTARICQDVAVSPFMWVAPLSLYLLTFIICFDGESWYRRLPTAVLAAGSVLAVCMVMLADEIEQVYAEWGLPVRIAHLDNNVVAEAAVALAMLFFVCMVCHGELVRRKPPPAGLTMFYLLIAAGGAMGGVTVGLLCPLLLDFTAEWNAGLTVCFLLSCYVAIRAVREAPADKRPSLPLRISGTLLIAAGLMIVVWAQLSEYSLAGLARQRSFYGVLRVDEYNAGTEDEGRALYNGRVLHGYQHWAPGRRREPTTYYGRESGVGAALRTAGDRGPLRVGVVGLGAGTLAAYGRADDQYRFYEINPQAIDFARRHFTFLDDCPAEVETVLGDGRVSLENEPPQDFDILVLDAFSGDSIPVHLLTLEAMQVYRRHLGERSVVCVHISNRHLDLRPVVAALAQRFELAALEVRADNAAGLSKTASSWVLLSADRELLSQIESRYDARPLRVRRPLLWTDKYSNLLEILK